MAFTIETPFTLPSGLTLVDLGIRQAIRCDDCRGQIFADEFGGRKGTIRHGRRCDTPTLQPARVDAETGEVLPTCEWARLPDGTWGLRGVGLVRGCRAVVVRRTGERQEVTVGEILWSEEDGTRIAAKGSRADRSHLEAVAAAAKRGEAVHAGSEQDLLDAVDAGLCTVSDAMNQDF